MERQRPKQQQLNAAQLCRYLHALQQHHASLCRSLQQHTPPCRASASPPRVATRATQTSRAHEANDTAQRLAALERTLQEQAACVARLAAMQSSPCCHAAASPPTAPPQQQQPAVTPDAGLVRPVCPSTPPAHQAWGSPSCAVGHPVHSPCTPSVAHHQHVPEALLRHLDAVLRSTEEEAGLDAQQAAYGLHDLHDALTARVGGDVGGASVCTDTLIDDVQAMLQ